MPLPQRLRHITRQFSVLRDAPQAASAAHLDIQLQDVLLVRTEVNRLHSLTENELGLLAARAGFAGELAQQKTQLPPLIDILDGLTASASPAQRAAVLSLCAALDAQASAPLDAAVLSLEAESATRLLIAEVLASRERLFVLQQAVRTLKALPARRARSSAAHPSGERKAVMAPSAAADNGDDYDDPIAGAAAAMGLGDAETSLAPRKRLKLTSQGKLVLLDWCVFASVESLLVGAAPTHYAELLIIPAPQAPDASL
jgi:hypothetical protein